MKKAINLPDEIKELLTQVILPPDSKSIGKPIVELGLPKTTLIAIIERDNNFFTPSGSTVLQEGDRLTILSDNKEDLQQACIKLDAQVKTSK